MRSVLATKSLLGTEYRTENPFCCGLRTLGKLEVCLKKDEDDHGPLEHQRISRLSDGPFCSLPSALHANTTQTTATTCKIFFLRLWFKTSHIVVSESKNKSFVSRIVFFIFTLKCTEVILPHSVFTAYNYDTSVRNCFIGLCLLKFIVVVVSWLLILFLTIVFISKKLNFTRNLNSHLLIWK